MKTKKTSTLRRLCVYLLQYKWLLLLALALTVGSNLFALIGPALCGRAIDLAEMGPGKVDLPAVERYALWMALFYVASAVMTYLLNVLMIVISRKVTYRMRRDMFRRLADLPVGYFDSHPVGDIISRISYDTDTINGSLSTDLVQIFASVITVAGSLIMMLRIAPKLVLVFVVTVPLSMLITRRISKKTHPLFRLRSRRLGELNGFAEEMISGQKTLKAYCQEENTLSELDEYNERAVEAYYQAEYHVAGMGPSTNFINNLSLTLISVFGAMMYMAGASPWAISAPSCFTAGSSAGRSGRWQTSSTSCSPPWRRRNGSSASWTSSRSRRIRQTPGRWARCRGRWSWSISPLAIRRGGRCSTT